jgi:hypothetical protein
MKGLWVPALLLLGAAACGQNPYEAKVDGVVLVEADRVVMPEKAPVVKLTLDELEPEVPPVAVVQLAIGLDVTWDRVKTTITAMRDQGVRPVLLVGVRQDVRAIVLSDELEGPSIHLTSTPDGKFCVGPPTSNEAKCVQSADRKHISRAFVRELIRDAVEAYDLHDVDVQVTGDLYWADVVRTVDGARTCCGKIAVRVKLADDPTI